MKDYNSQTLATQAEKGDQIVSLLLAIKEGFDLMGEDVVELSTEKDTLKNKRGSFDEK